MSTRPRLRLRLAKLFWGWEAHHTQLQWLLNDAHTKVASCGRRWGKTEAAAIDAATMAIVHSGSVQMIVSPSYDQSKLIFDHVEKLMLGSPFTRGLTRVTRTPYPRLTFGNSLIMARTADEDGRNLRGHSADRVIVDEAAYVRDSVITDVISPMLADHDGRLVMISTPFGKNHFYRAFVRGSESGDQGTYASFTFPSWSNPHINGDYIERQRDEISPRQFAVEYEAQFVDDQSSVFSWEDINRACRLSNPITLSTNPVTLSSSPVTLSSSPLILSSSKDAAADYDSIVAGIDWARYHDYTAVIAVGVNESGCEVIGIDRFNKMGWQAQIDRVVDFIRTYGVSVALTDATSLGDPLLGQLQLRLHDSRVDAIIEGYGFTNSSKRDLIEHLVLKFAHGTVSIPRDEHLMRELQYFEYELTSSGNVRMNARSGYHDDLVIALALACWQAKSAPVGGGYLSGGGRVAVKGW